MTNPIIKVFREAPEEVYAQVQTDRPETRHFYKEGRLGVSEALKECRDSGYTVAYAPEFALARIAEKDKSSDLFKWNRTLSIKAEGKTKQGSPVVIYAHVPHYFSNPENINDAVENGELINRAGILPYEEFQRLLDLEDGKRVFVLSGNQYKKLKNFISGVVSVDSALDHPQTIPFLGGEEIAVPYLKKHKEVYGNNIGIWHVDDLHDEPVARLVSFGYYLYFGLDANNDLDNDARFFGVATESLIQSKNSNGNPSQLEDKVQELGDGRIKIGNVIYTPEK